MEMYSSLQQFLSNSCEPAFHEVTESITDKRNADKFFHIYIANPYVSIESMLALTMAWPFSYMCNNIPQKEYTT